MFDVDRWGKHRGWDRLRLLSSESHFARIDLRCPLWNLFDLTPAGRGEDWYPSNEAFDAVLRQLVGKR
jgi:hypothetical protein